MINTRKLLSPVRRRKLDEHSFGKGSIFVLRGSQLTTTYFDKPKNETKDLYDLSSRLNVRTWLILVSLKDIIKDTHHRI